MSSEERSFIRKQYTLCIAAIFWNEAPYFKEWIEYHRLVGVDHFYLYNNESTDSYLEELSPYIQEGLVSLVDWPDEKPPPENKKAIYSWVYHTQVPAYEDACRKSAGKTEWLAIIDIDEFMVPITSPNLKELLVKYADAPGIMLHWQIYGTSGVSSLLPKQLLVEALHMTALPEDTLNSKVVKSIIKPELYRSFSWLPHACVFQNGQSAVDVDKSEAQVNHYINRTVDYFFTHKVAKKEHMDNEKFLESEIQSMLNMGNEREDQERAILRFTPALRRQLGYDHGI